jgi:enoyl-CoA hydratase
MEGNTRVIVTRGRVSRIHLNRPDKQNAVDTAMLVRLASVLQELLDDDECRGVLFSAEGPHFCAGRDLNDVARISQSTAGQAMTTQAPIPRIFQLLAEATKVTSVAVQGNALGLGIGLSAACDITVADPNSVFGMPEARFGFAPFGVLPSLQKVLPHKVLLDLSLTGDTIAAQKALEIGLVNRISEPGKASQTALEIVTRVASQDTGYVSSTKRAVELVRHLDDNQSIAVMRDKVLLHHVGGQTKVPERWRRDG